MYRPPHARRPASPPRNNRSVTTTTDGAAKKNGQSNNGWTTVGRNGKEERPCHDNSDFVNLPPKRDSSPKRKPQVGGEQCSEWIAAAQNGDLAHLKSIRASNPSLYPINESWYKGSTALHWAIDKKHIAVAIYLIQEGGDVNLASKRYGNTPLHWAVWRGLPEMVGILLNHGADASAKDQDGKTPLDMARELKPSPQKPEIIRLLSQKDSKC